MVLILFLVQSPLLVAVVQVSAEVVQEETQAMQVLLDKVTQVETLQ
jgi:hypothetical protein